MSDIFISYKREEQATARNLANALETQGWSVWWDPKLRAGERFNDVIEKALKESKCVVVMWSKRSVESQYVKDEATYALNRTKLVPVMIDEVELPFRFEGLHTPNLLGWDGSKDFSEFRGLVDDISAILGPSPTTAETEGSRKVEEEHLREKEQQRSEEEARRKAEEANRRRIDQEVLNPWRTYGPVFAAIAVVLIIFSFVFWWPKRQESDNVFRDRLKSGGEGPEMVVVSAGSFRMGDVQGGGFPSEHPVRTVRIEQPFAIGRYEVTFVEYDQFAGAIGRQLPDDGGSGRGSRPVINVSWRDAVEYVKWLSEQTDKRYRLLTEAEWEYVARGGRETAYWWGKEFLKRMANCNGCGSQWDNKETAPVGSFKPNPRGLYDTAGNVLEWVEDCWHRNYNGAPADGSAWKEAGGGNCELHVTRGGSFGSEPEHLRTSARRYIFAVNRSGHIGFRIARDLD